MKGLTKNVFLIAIPALIVIGLVLFVQTASADLPQYPENLSNGTETVYHNHIIYKNNNVYADTLSDYTATKYWFPDDNPLKDYANLTMEVKIDNGFNNIIIHGSTLVPRYFNGTVLINTTNDSVFIILDSKGKNLNKIIDLEYSNTFTPCKRDGDASIDLNGTANVQQIEDKCFYDYKQLDRMTLNRLRTNVITSPIFIDPTVSVCGDLTGAGTYILNQSITTTGHCLRTSGDDMIIDCNGFTITGDADGSGADCGITSNGRTRRLIVKNCIITKFDRGAIKLPYSVDTIANVTIINNSFVSNTYASGWKAVNLATTGTYINISGNTFLNNIYGAVSASASGGTPYFYNNSLIGTGTTTYLNGGWLAYNNFYNATDCPAGSINLINLVGTSAKFYNNTLYHTGSSCGIIDGDGNSLGKRVYNNYISSASAEFMIRFPREDAESENNTFICTGVCGNGYYIGYERISTSRNDNFTGNYTDGGVFIYSDASSYAGFWTKMYNTILKTSGTIDIRSDYMVSTDIVDMYNITLSGDVVTDYYVHKGGLKLKGSNTASAVAPAGWLNVGSKYINIPSESGTYNATFNMSYNGIDVSAYNESTIKLMYYNGGAWKTTSLVGIGNDITSNMVWATFEHGTLVGTNQIGMFINSTPLVTNTCTYSGSGNWNIAMSDYCNITTTQNISGNITTYNTGWLNISACMNFTSTNQWWFSNSSGTESYTYWSGNGKIGC